jgi:DNA-binding CsgD family transcriptional regulator
MRYRAYKRNTPKRICAELGINRKTLLAYVRELSA